MIQIKIAYTQLILKWCIFHFIRFLSSVYVNIHLEKSNFSLLCSHAYIYIYSLVYVPFGMMGSRYFVDILVEMTNWCLFRLLEIFTKRFELRCRILYLIQIEFTLNWDNASINIYRQSTRTKFYHHSYVYVCVFMYIQLVAEAFKPSDEIIVYHLV